MSIKIKWLFIFNLLVVFLLMVACGTPPEEPNHDEEDTHTEDHQADHPDEDTNENLFAPLDLAEGEPLRVVATTNIVGDLVQNVGGETIELTTLLPIGTDPHTFDPSPQDIAAVASAHVVFANGLHLEEFLDELIDNAGGEAIVVPLSTYVIPTEELTDEAQGHQHAGVDPHIWLNPIYTTIMVHHATLVLSSLDPTHIDEYESNSSAYLQKLNDLDDWIEAEINTIPFEQRILVTDHDAFGYYADRYGLTIVGTVLPTFSTNAEPSAKALTELQQAIAQTGAPAIFVGESVTPVLAERMAEDMGIKLVPLYTGSLGEAGSGAETYLDYMRYNTNAIVEALP